MCFWPTVGLTDVSAVGRLENTTQPQTCTGTLIAPGLVLSAAHCVAALRDAEGAEGAQIVFRPGGYSGAATFVVSRTVVHPLYPVTPAANGWNLRFDLALFVLEADVPANLAVPLMTGREATLGETLFLVSWRASESAPPRQRACKVIEGLTGLVTLACPVRGGESGSPLLRKTEAGLELVSVVSSRRTQGPQPVALSSDVAVRLPPLLDAIRASEGS